MTAEIEEIIISNEKIKADETIEKAKIKWDKWIGYTVLTIYILLGIYWVGINSTIVLYTSFLLNIGLILYVKRASLLKNNASGLITVLIFIGIVFVFILVPMTATATHNNLNIDITNINHNQITQTNGSFIVSVYVMDNNMPIYLSDFTLEFNEKTYHSDSEFSIIINAPYVKENKDYTIHVFKDGNTVVKDIGIIFNPLPEIPITEIQEGSFSVIVFGGILCLVFSSVFLFGVKYEIIQKRALELKERMQKNARDSIQDYQNINWMDKRK